MRETAEDMRQKMKEAERKHRLTHMNQIIESVNQNLEKIEISNMGTIQKRRRKKEDLFRALGLLDGRHVNTISESIHYILIKILHTAGWFSIRIRTLFTSVRKVQRCVRQWLITISQKKALLLHIWSSTEAQDQSLSNRKLGKKRFTSSQQFSSINDISANYFRKWVPKELKLDVIHDLYNEAKLRWKKRYADWRFETRQQRCSVRERKLILKKMYRCENNVRYLCGLPPSVRDDREMIDTQISPSPGFFWLEELVTEYSVDHLTYMAYLKDRERSIAVLVPGLSATERGALLKKKHLDAEDLLPMEQTRPVILSELLRNGHRSIVFVLSGGFHHPLLAGQKEGIDPVNILRRTPKQRRAEAQRKSVDLTARTAILMNAPIQQAVEIADHQATQTFISNTFNHEKSRLGSLHAKTVARKMSILNTGFTAGYWETFARQGDRLPIVKSKEKQRWARFPVQKRRPDPVSYFKGRCTFDNCDCQMFKIIGREATQRGGTLICASCNHWNRYHGLSESSLLLWRADATFGPVSYEAKNRDSCPAGVVAPVEGVNSTQGVITSSSSPFVDVALAANSRMQESDLPQKYDLTLFRKSSFYKKHVLRST